LSEVWLFIIIIIFNVLLHLIHLNGIIVHGNLLFEVVWVLFLFAEGIVVNRSEAWVLMAVVPCDKLTLAFVFSFWWTHLLLLLTPPRIASTRRTRDPTTPIHQHPVLLPALSAATLYPTKTSS
jgi:hypothetical protein